MAKEYTHLDLGEDYATGPAGHFALHKEGRLRYDGREVLCVIGQAVVESSCCGVPGSWGYALVPGYIVNWKNKRNEAGLPVSEVEPISDEKVREHIRHTIESDEGVPQVEFW